MQNAAREVRRKSAPQQDAAGLLASSDQLVLSGSIASRNGWVRVSDGTGRVFYHSIDSGNITLERPPRFGDDNPTWADGTELFMYRGSCSRCKDFLGRGSAGPVALSADHGQTALSFLLCRPCLNWLIDSARLELEGKPPVEHPQTIPTEKPVRGRGGGGGGSGSRGRGNRRPGDDRKHLVKVSKHIDLKGAGDVLARSPLARGFAKCMYSRLNEQTLRPGRFDEQRDECLKAKAAAVVAGEGRRRAAREMQMKLRCISRHKSHGGGDYLCWFSTEGRVDYFGETSGGKAHGWGLAEYQDGSWCLSVFSLGQQHTPKGGRLSTIQYANGIRYHGEMKQGHPNGRGTKTWPDGSEYIGEFSRGKEHGDGKKAFSDGSEHSGNWRAGVRDGPGVFIDARGQKTVGVFHDDVFGKPEEEGIVAPTKADITIESGQHDPETLLDLAIATLAVVMDRQPGLNKASVLLAKVPLHLHGLVAEAFASGAQGLSPGFRKGLTSFALRSVPELRLCNAMLLPADTAKLPYFLEAIPDLKKLSVVACKLARGRITPIADAIATSEGLEEVDLSWNPIRREGIRAVIAALETSPRLRCLSLAGCQLGGDGGQAIIKAIGSGRELFRLLDLDLSHNSLGAGSGEALAAAVGRNETLTRLSLRANGLGPVGGAFLAKGLARNCGSLKELIVADNRLGPRVATLLAATMRAGTAPCLRGFGYSPRVRPQHEEGALPQRSRGAARPLEGAGKDGRSSCSKKTAPSSAENVHIDTDDHDDNGMNAAGDKVVDTGANCTLMSSCGMMGPRGGLGNLDRRFSTNTGGVATVREAAAAGRGGVGGVEGYLCNRNGMGVAGATALEEQLGRPQTAGTASG